jgi:hypothetical protein
MEKTIFHLIKQYGSDYLYGFDKDQFKLDLMGGKVNLRVVNLKPDKINETLSELGIPIWVKSGMLTDLNVKLSSWSLINEFTFKKLTSKKLQSDKASIEVTVDEILIVLGTSQANMSNEHDFDWDRDPVRSYVSIEEERRHIPKKKKSKESEEKKQHTKQLPDNTVQTAPEYIKMVIEMFMNLISINVNKIHIRFEDDYFSYIQGPYAFGLTLNSLNINNTDKEIEFRSPLDLDYQEVYPEHPTNLFLKHILLRDI